MDNKTLINDISKNSGINLKLIKQLPIKSYPGRAVHYICENENNKYIIAVAYTSAQKYRLKRVINNIKYIDSNWRKYIKVNEPINYGEVSNVFLCHI